MSLTESHQHILIQVARKAIEHGLNTGESLFVTLKGVAAELCVHRASFVTLKIKGELRGCIGSIVPILPLIQDVAYHAYAAAFADYRFSPLTALEWPQVELHISILTVPEALKFNSEQELIEQLRPGIDGLILEAGSHRSTFLPAVWESLPQPQEFLRQLKCKAGLPADYWAPTIQVQRYITESIHAPPYQQKTANNVH
ncbi:MAG: AmmeMemoRadiSam system protein A [Pseudomonadota bacterium]|nr:AmmeMemoRadiSam system protein A [Pseudomonadota bacterium]